MHGGLKPDQNLPPKGRRAWVRYQWLGEVWSERAAEEARREQAAAACSELQFAPLVRTRFQLAASDWVPGGDSRRDLFLAIT